MFDICSEVDDEDEKREENSKEVPLIKGKASINGGDGVLEINIVNVESRALGGLCSGVVLVN